METLKPNLGVPDLAAEEFSGRRLELLAECIEACRQYLNLISKGLPAEDNYEELKKYLIELKDWFPPNPKARGLEAYLGFYESRELRRLLKRLPPKQYQELDELVELPGDSWIGRAENLIIAFKDALVFGLPSKKGRP